MYDESIGESVDSLNSDDKIACPRQDAEGHSHPNAGDGQSVDLPVASNPCPATPTGRRRHRQLAAAAKRSQPRDCGASYGRFSSHLQSEASLPDQHRKNRELAERNGHHIPPELEFSDAAVSGTKLSRDGLELMLRAAEAGEFIVLYLYSLSRLARESVITMPMLKKLVHSFRVRVISVTEGIDSDRDGWELIASLISVMNERFIKDLGMSVHRGQEGVVLAGHSVGDYRFGYTSVAIPGTETTQRGRPSRPDMAYAIDDETAAWVTRIFHWFVVDRQTIRWIMRELNARNAPKDHRAITSKWYHTQVVGVLESAKYIGVWPWGEMQNELDPFTGKVHQVPRPNEDCEKWTRHFPELRLIADDVFEKAQQLLHENYVRFASRRRPNGTLKAAREADGSRVPGHLLSGIIQCAECNSTFNVSGTGGKYLSCPGYPKGICRCKTQLRRDRAERMILMEIGRRIADNPAWRDAVYQQLLRRWRQEENQVPAELAAAEKAIVEVDRRIANIIAAIENGIVDPGVSQRLQQYRREREELVQKRDLLLRFEETRIAEPTIEWLQQQLHDLGVCLRGTTPAAAYALRELVGRIVVREIPREGRKRCQFRGEFTLAVGALVAAATGTSQAASPQECAGGEALFERICIDFVDPNPLDAKAAMAKELYDRGLLHCDIGRKLKCSRSMVTQLLKHAFQLLGQPFRDGRGRRFQLAKKQTEAPTVPDGFR